MNIPNRWMHALRVAALVTLFLLVAHLWRLHAYNEGVVDAMNLMFQVK